jgi:hypothetical protein
MEWLKFNGTGWVFEKELSATFAICRDDALAMYRALQAKIEVLEVSRKEKSLLLLELDRIWRRGLTDRHNNL